ncbi:MAG: carboxypeptidase regulatory-like domain-containing protein [Rhodanobacter sp.]
MAIVLGVCRLLTGPMAQAQDPAATIFGWAPVGQTITVHGNTGTTRHSKAKGRYSVGSLRMGTCTVTLEKDDKRVDTRSNIGLTVGRGAEVDFSCEHDQCVVTPN